MLNDGAWKTGYDRVTKYLLHCAGEDTEANIFSAIVDDSVLSNTSSFLSGGNLGLWMGDSNTGNVSVNNVALTGDSGNGKSYWSTEGNSWSIDENNPHEQPDDSNGGINLTHIGSASPADAMTYKTSLNGNNGFTVSFTLDFTGVTGEQSVYFGFSSADGQKLYAQIIAGVDNKVFGTVGTFYDNGWTGQAFRADNWVANTSNKIIVTLQDTGHGVLNISLADAGGAGSFNQAIDGGEAIWTIPGFLNKELTYSMYGDNFTVSGLAISGYANNTSDWTLGSNWTVKSTKIIVADSVNLKHTDTDNNMVVYTGTLNGAFSIDFKADFSNNSTSEALYFTIQGTDGRRLHCRILSDATAVLGTDGYVEGNLVFRAENWMSNLSRCARIHVESDGSSKLTISIYSILKGCEKGVYCDSNGWNEWLPAATEGRMLVGAANILRWEDRGDMRQIINTIIDKLEKQVKSNGYYGYYDESDFAVINGGEAERKNFDRVYWTRGMLAAGASGNKSAYTILRNFYNWFNNSEYLGTLLNGSNVTNAFPGNALIAMSPIGTKEDLLISQKYLDLHFWMKTLTEKNPLSYTCFPADRPHTYLNLTLETMIYEYMMTGDSDYLKAVLGGWDVYNTYYEHIGGSAAICESTTKGAYPPGSYYLRTKCTGELCGSVFWTDVNSLLLQLYPQEEKYAAEIEKSIYNVVLAAQDNSGYIRYHAGLDGSKDSTGCVSSCCEDSSTGLITKLPELIYSIADDGIYVNQYVASVLDFDGDNSSMKLTMDTNFPYDNTVTMTVNTTLNLSEKIRIRIPSWASDSVNVKVNGETVVTGTPGSYVTLDREWSDGDVITFALPIESKLVKYTGYDQISGCERYTLMNGPIEMALTGVDAGDKGTAALNVEAGQLLNLLRRTDNQDELCFAIDGIDEAKYVPYWTLQSGYFTCYPIIGR
jgi:hypothetical protein